MFSKSPWRAIDRVPTGWNGFVVHVLAALAKRQLMELGERIGPACRTSGRSRLLARGRSIAYSMSKDPLNTSWKSSGEVRSRPDECD